MIIWLVLHCTLFQRTRYTVFCPSRSRHCFFFQLYHLLHGLPMSFLFWLITIPPVRFHYKYNQLFSYETTLCYIQCKKFQLRCFCLFRILYSWCPALGPVRKILVYRLQRIGNIFLVLYWVRSCYGSQLYNSKAWQCF